MAYYPGMRKLAAKYVPRQYREDLVTDTIIYCLAHWQSFREDGGFWTWITWCMRGVVSNRAQAARARKGLVLVPEGNAYETASTPPAQDRYVELSDVLGKITGTRNGRVLLRRAMGDQMLEIANDIGVTKARVDQIEKRERKRLRKAVG
jgi:RNA polymerase sigma factor (sigma-70 family)